MSTVAQAQNDDKNRASSIAEYLQELIENQENEGVEDFNTLAEELEYYLTQPLNINTADAEDFSSLVFLTENETRAIIRHRELYGDLVDIYELQAIRGLPIAKARLLKEISTVANQRSLSGTTALANEHVLYLKTRYTLQEQKGFRSDGTTPAKYTGSRPSLYARWRGKTSSGWDMGITLEKDAGERLWTEAEGLDFFSFFIQKKNLNQYVKHLGIGDYHLRIGQGLTMMTGFANGKSSLTTDILPRGQSMRPFTSASENAALRGIIGEVALTDRLSGMAYTSYRDLDANELFDENDNVRGVSSYQTSGNHRTVSELDDQDALGQTISGLSVRYDLPHGDHLRLNGITMSQSLPLDRSDRPYNQLRWEGTQLTNLSIDGSYSLSSVFLSGEVAHSLQSGWARMISASTSLDPKLNMTLLYRDFDADYHAIRGSTFSERSAVENERGLYLGLEYQPHKKWRINAYIDQWSHDWLRFNVDAPTQGSDYLLRVLYRQRKKRDIYLQLRWKNTQEEGDEERRYDYIADRSTYKIRAHWSEIASDTWEWRARAEVALSTLEQDKDKGYGIYTEGVWTPSGSGLSLSGRVMYFDVDGSAARIYAYERDLQYEYSIPGWSGTGWRYYALAKYRINKKLKAELKIAHTQYSDDRETISSGNTEIQGAGRTDIKLQLRYKL